jgi:hypothetical protein
VLLLPPATTEAIFDDVLFIPPPTVEQLKVELVLVQNQIKFTNQTCANES